MVALALPCVDPLSRPIEVHASHLGMAIDPRVLDIVVGQLTDQQRTEVRAATA